MKRLYEALLIGVFSLFSVELFAQLIASIPLTGAINTEEEGSYIITYIAKDIAGNISKTQKCVTVYNPDSFNVFVNGRLALGNQINLNDKKLDITAINAEGDLEAKYLPGKKYVGDFKTKGTKISTDGELPSVGYYTIYLQDKDRNARLAYVFIQE